MNKVSPISVLGHGGLSGVLLDPLPLPPGRDHVRLSLADGRVLELPAEMLSEQADGTYRMEVGPEDLDQAPRQSETAVPVVDEELVVGKRAVPTGGIRVHKDFSERQENIDMLLRKERVEVRHVRVNRDIDGPLSVRQKGDTTIIPIVEEVLVVEKRLRLVEEIHVTRHKTEERHREQVTLRREEARVERIDEKGSPVPQVVRARDGGPSRRPRRKSILAD